MPITLMFLSTSASHVSVGRVAERVYKRRASLTLTGSLLTQVNSYSFFFFPPTLDRRRRNVPAPDRNER